MEKNNRTEYLEKLSFKDQDEMKQTTEKKSFFLCTGNKRKNRSHENRKILCIKKQYQQSNRQLIEWEKIFTSHIMITDEYLEHTENL